MRMSWDKTVLKMLVEESEKHTPHWIRAPSCLPTHISL